MRKNIVRLGCMVLAGLMVLSLVPPAVACTFKSPLPPFDPQAVDATQCDPKFDQMMVILDASSSMGEYITLENWYPKFKIAKEFIHRFNQTFPEVEVGGALRTFGHSTWYSTERTKLVLAPALYNTQSFDTALKPVGPPGGHSPLDEALDAAGEDYKAVNGKVALILVSDGKELGSRPLASVQRLRDTFGDRLCVFAVQVGRDPAGRRDLGKLIEGDACGGDVYNAQDLMTGTAMADFIKANFCTTPPAQPAPPAAPVAPPIKSAPPVAVTPAPPAATVPTQVLDSDGDGVPDGQDRCPGTPVGARVNAEGCWVTGVPLFDFDQAVIKAEYFKDMDEVAGILLKNPNLKIRIDGHTCSIGSHAYNLGLSERRAEAARKYLIKKGVGPERLTKKGFSFDQPVATNKTREGRGKNRRIEFSPLP